jgi:hypothetical protein
MSVGEETPVCITRITAKFAARRHILRDYGKTVSVRRALQINCVATAHGLSLHRVTPSVQACWALFFRCR